MIISLEDLARRVEPPPAKWEFPSRVTTMGELHDWLYLLPGSQRDWDKNEDATKTPKVFGFGVAIHREDRTEDMIATERAKLINSFSFALFGFLLACDGSVVWRTRPEFDQQTDYVTDNVLIKCYARLARV